MASFIIPILLLIYLVLVPQLRSLAPLVCVAELHGSSGCWKYWNIGVGPPTPVRTREQACVILSQQNFLVKNYSFSSSFSLSFIYKRIFNLFIQPFI